jgi:tRNA1Val (adenine37-N6)-methyltransferase
MGNSFFRFKQFTVQQGQAAMKVTTDACLFGAWAAKNISTDHSAAKDLLDIGTGTGLLSLMVAQQTNTTIDAIEIDEQAAEQATANAAESPWKERITVLQGDARTFDSPKQYDVIISNPPFYENELKSGNIKKDTAHHDDGLTLQQLLLTISARLKENGTFYLLLPFKRYQEVLPMLRNAGMKLEKLCVVKQSVTHSFFRVMIAGGKKETIEQEEEIAIKDDTDQYTTAFISLLKEYYLYL